MNLNLSSTMHISIIYQDFNKSIKLKRSIFYPDNTLRTLYNKSFIRIQKVIYAEPK